MTEPQHDDRLIFLIGQARQRLYTRLDQALLDQAGVTTAQAGALFFLSQNDGCLLLELSRVMADLSSITRMAGRLEKKTLVERRPCPGDGRAVRVYLTPAGRKTAKGCLATVRAHNEAIKDGFSDSDIKNFSRILQTVIQRFREE